MQSDSRYVLDALCTLSCRALQHSATGYVTVELKGPSRLGAALSFHLDLTHTIEGQEGEDCMNDVQLAVTSTLLPSSSSSLRSHRRLHRCLHHYRRSRHPPGAVAAVYPSLLQQ